MRTKQLLLLLLFLCFGLCVLAGDFSKMPYHRFRKVGDKYFDLQPVYDWLKVAGVPSNQLTRDMTSKPRPMSEWVGGFSRFDAISTDRVYQVLPEGLLLTTRTVYAAGFQSHEGAIFFLTNYPFASQLTDGQTIEFLAVKVGTFHYKDTLGALRTVPMFDYGVPYDPWKLLKEKQATTNAPAGP